MTTIYKVELHSPHAAQFAVSWETDSARFHVWLDGPGEFDPESVALYKNPLKGAAYQFDTRHLDLTAKTWAATVADLQAIPAQEFVNATNAANDKEAAAKAQRAADVETSERATLAALFAKYGPPKTGRGGPTSFSIPESLDTVWDALGAYRSDLIPEGDSAYDSEWDDICTAMAWITEATAPETVSESELLEAAACIWEAVLELHQTPPLADETAAPFYAVQRASQNMGAAALRTTCTAWAKSVHLGWLEATRHGYDSPFDWEFVPAFVLRAVDWDAVELRPDWLEICQDIGVVK